MSAPWRARLQQSLQQNASLAYSKYVQLATVRPNGRPANRTVVFRGFLEGTDHLTFITDKRSNKVSEAAANPAAEVCWYFPTSREQYRVSGLLTVVDSSASEPDLIVARAEMWNSISAAAKYQFFWPHPGFPRLPEYDEAYVVPQDKPMDQAPECFCLLVLKVDEVDLLELFTNSRTVFTPQQGQPGQWDVLDVTP